MTVVIICTLVDFGEDNFSVGRTGQFKAENPESPTAFIPADDEPALLPYVAKMSEDLLEFDQKNQ